MNMVEMTVTALASNLPNVGQWNGDPTWVKGQCCTPQKISEDPDGSGWAASTKLVTPSRSTMMTKPWPSTPSPSLVVPGQESTFLRLNDHRTVTWASPRLVFTSTLWAGEQRVWPGCLKMNFQSWSVSQNWDNNQKVWCCQPTWPTTRVHPYPLSHYLMGFCHLFDVEIIKTLINFQNHHHYCIRSLQQ